MTGIERLRASTPAVVAVLRDLAQETELTNDELLAVLGFLTEVGRADEFILLSDVLGISRLVDDATHAGVGGTPSAVLGPFYCPGAPEIPNPGSIRREADTGEPLLVSGKVTDAADGRSLAGAVVDVWQANADGVYSNEDDALPTWNLRGRQRTDADGRYAIETVRPSHYTVKHDGPVGRLLELLARHPWRPAHIHFLVTAGGFRPLVTQAYLAGGPYLDDDAIAGVKDELIVAVDDGCAIFDITLTAGR